MGDSTLLIFRRPTPLGNSANSVCIIVHGTRNNYSAGKFSSSRCQENLELELYFFSLRVFASASKGAQSHLHSALCCFHYTVASKGNIETRAMGKSSMDDKAKFLLFGPQVASFNEQSWDNLRRRLASRSDCHWILDTITGLPSFWDAFINRIPRVSEKVPGRKLLVDLDSWLRRDLGGGQKDADLPNTLLMPLVVISHLTQYRRFLQLNWQRSERKTEIGETEPNFDLELDLLRKQNVNNGCNVETLGFCTGLLSAFAVASSNNQEEFEEYGAAAIRLAMLIGALVDADDERSRSYVTSWSTAEEADGIKRVVDNLFPDAYASVLYDEKRTTITVSESSETQLLKQLHAVGAGVNVVEAGPKGRFHSSDIERRRNTDALIELCNSIDGLRFAHIAQRTYGNGGEINTGNLHETALRAILIEQYRWHQTCSAALEKVITDSHNAAVLVSFGPRAVPIPPTVMRRLGSRLELFNHDDILHPTTKKPETPSPDTYEHDHEHEYEHEHVNANKDKSQDVIAVVGMSIQVAGADDLDEFSQMLQKGTSQHEEILPDRLMSDTLFREGTKDSSRKWYGNFIRDVDAFDHKFFRRSPRESSTMDPQQRRFLQAAYQAVEQSGYFNEPPSAANTKKRRDKQHVGVYLGACAGDYEHHVACHPANAFTATGNLKSFIPGKVAHHFGWTVSHQLFVQDTQSAIPSQCPIPKTSQHNVSF